MVQLAGEKKLGAIMSKTTKTEIQRQSDTTPEEKRLRYEYIAHQIHREDSLVNFRLTWSLTLNGFIFAALWVLLRIT
jgi:hypothetical protein